MDARRDLADWTALLEEGGVREARLHDARHAAVTASPRNDIAKRLGAFLWQEGRRNRARGHRTLPDLWSGAHLTCTQGTM